MRAMRAKETGESDRILTIPGSRGEILQLVTRFKDPLSNFQLEESKKRVTVLK